MAPFLVRQIDFKCKYERLNNPEKKTCRPFFASKMPRGEIRDKNNSTIALKLTKLNVAFASALTARLTANSIFKVSFFYPSRPAK